MRLNYQKRKRTKILSERRVWFGFIYDLYQPRNSEKVNETAQSEKLTLNTSLTPTQLNQLIEVTLVSK